MISFIIIGRNEGWRLELCLTSTVKVLTDGQLDAEIIYVDSKSTDDSIKVANQFSEVNTFLITGRYNAAIARNIGVKESKGDSLIFLDGDMEVNPDFLNLILDEQGVLKHDFVSGNFMNYYYDVDGNFLRKDFYRKIYCEKDTLQNTTGGLFAVKRSVWDSVGGMRNMFKKGQDLDFGYRLALKGIPLLRKKELMANHHTIDYNDTSRLWRSFIDGRYLYTRSVLYRSNFYNKYVIKRMLTSDPTWLLLIGMIVLAALTHQVWPFMVYGFLTAIAVAYNMRKGSFVSYPNRLINHMCRDLYSLFAFIFIYPKRKLKLKYKRV
ncbi:glycosyltransferase family 2 protein [Labilibacter marinus]|uniref:glycosyltransferase family 2 protein n=1 Tax=Labilibacter marinus TaxID=1477105 RepID=UPI00094F6AC9|nr:glycosyltransferase [Labilibacter marinus]